MPANCQTILEIEMGNSNTLEHFVFVNSDYYSESMARKWCHAQKLKSGAKQNRSLPRRRITTIVKYSDTVFT